MATPSSSSDSTDVDYGPLRRSGVLPPVICGPGGLWRRLRSNQPRPGDLLGEIGGKDLAGEMGGDLLGEVDGEIADEVLAQDLGRAAISGEPRFKFVSLWNDSLWVIVSLDLGLARDGQTCLFGNFATLSETC